MKKTILTLIALILTTGPLRPQSGPAGSSAAVQKSSGIKQSNPVKYPLASLVSQALEQNPLLESFKSRVEERQALARQTAVWPNPVGSFTAGRKSVESPDGSSNDGSLYEVSLSQTFLMPGKLRARSAVADAEVKLAVLSQSEAEISLISEIVRLAYDCEINRRKMEFAQTRLKRFESVGEYLQGNVFVSPQRRAERRIVESHIKEIVTEKLESQTAFRSSLEKLMLYMPGHPESLEIEVPQLSGGRSPDPAQWQNHALEHNPELAAQRALVERTRREKSAAAKESWPDIESSIFYGRESAADTERTSGLGLSVPLPVFNRNRGVIQSIVKRTEAEKKLQDFKERELASKMEILLLDTDSARQKILNYPLSLAGELEKEFKEVEAEFRKGRVDFLVFVEFESELAETYYRALDAQRSLAEKLAALFALAGRKDLADQLPNF